MIVETQHSFQRTFIQINPLNNVTDLPSSLDIRVESFHPVSIRG